MRRPRIARAYAARRDRLRTLFPAANTFLHGLESHDGLWLSTATNAHVYFDRRFLAYVQIDAPDLAPPTIRLSPRYHLRIAEDAVDASALVFPLESWLTQHHPITWRFEAGGAVAFGVHTSERLFEQLVHHLAERGRS